MAWLQFRLMIIILTITVHVLVMMSTRNSTSIDLAKDMLPIVAVYFLHNILLTAYIATSYEVIDEETGLQDLALKKVYQYFILSARIDVRACLIVGKALPTFFRIKQFCVLPFFYIFGMIYSMMY